MYPQWIPSSYYFIVMREVQILQCFFKYDADPDISERQLPLLAIFYHLHM